jgi:hypothetical protein
MHLLRRLGPLHDLPDTPEGNLEHPDCVDDIGDTSLGITSPLALAWQRGKDPRLPEAVHRSLAFHLRERVHTEDNSG